MARIVQDAVEAVESLSHSGAVFSAMNDRAPAVLLTFLSSLGLAVKSFTGFTFHGPIPTIVQPSVHRRRLYQPGVSVSSICISGPTSGVYGSPVSPVRGFCRSGSAEIDGVTILLPSFDSSGFITNDDTEYVVSTIDMAVRNRHSLTCVNGVGCSGWIVDVAGCARASVDCWLRGE